MIILIMSHFFSDGMSLNTLYLNNINFEDDYFDDDDDDDHDDSETIVNVRFMAWSDRYKQFKGYTKNLSKELYL